MFMDEVQHGQKRGGLGHALGVPKGERAERLSLVVPGCLFCLVGHWMPGLGRQEGLPCGDCECVFIPLACQLRLNVLERSAILKNALERVDLCCLDFIWCCEPQPSTLRAPIHASQTAAADGPKDLSWQPPRCAKSNFHRHKTENNRETTK